MADLTWQEKRNLEAVLQMGGGYVLDFSNRTFHQFVTDCTGRNILDDDYEYATGSKANRLRAFWEKEPNELVGKLLICLLDYAETINPPGNDTDLYIACREITKRLLRQSISTDPGSMLMETQRAPARSESGTDCRYDFFIAHSGPDSRAANELYDLLATRVNTFLDSRNLLPGDNWTTELPLAQKRSLVTVVLISSQCGGAYYQREEIAAAISLAREHPEAHRVVPVYIEDVLENVPYGLRSLHALSLSREGGIRRVSTRLIELLETLKKRHNGAVKDNLEPFQLSSDSSEELVEEARTCGRASEEINWKEAVVLDKSRGTQFVEIQLPRLISLLPKIDRKRKAIVFVDIDDMTAINKRFGKQVGDEVLRSVACMLCSRKGITSCGRCGDDTFYAFCSQADKMKMHRISERIRQGVEKTDWSSVCSGLHVTCAGGYAILNAHESPGDWIIRAIQGLLEAKKNRGNTIKCGPLYLEPDENDEKMIVATLEKKRAVNLREFFS